MRGWSLVFAAWGGIALLMPAPAQGQVGEPPQVTVSVEPAYDRFSYYFENPSTFDSADAVPHNFEQTYWADNVWFAVSARYRLGGHSGRSEVALTPSRETRGDDIDTFFLPGGDVATSGTSGRIDIRSLRIRQEVAMASIGDWHWHLSYQYRRDRQEFHAQQTKTVTHSQPPSSISFPIVGAETTTSDVHEFGVGLRRQWRAGPWRVDGALDVAPSTYARLTTELPLKYPGQSIVFAAPVFTLSPSIEVQHGTRWPISIALAGVHTFSYRESQQFRRRMWRLSIGAGKTF